MPEMPGAVAWIPVVTWMAVIFLLSDQPAADSRDLSGSLVAIVDQALDRALGVFGVTAVPADGLGDLEHLLRKTAHFTEYLILGTLALLAVRPRRARWSSLGARTVARALLLCVGYAITDEVHQLFVPGRSGQWQDVLIDSAGVLTGIVLLLAAARDGRPGGGPGRAGTPLAAGCDTRGTRRRKSRLS